MRYYLSRQLRIDALQNGVDVSAWEVEREFANSFYEVENLDAAISSGRRRCQLDKRPRLKVDDLSLAPGV